MNTKVCYGLTAAGLTSSVVAYKEVCPRPHKCAPLPEKHRCWCELRPACAHGPACKLGCGSRHYLTAHKGGSRPHARRTHRGARREAHGNRMHVQCRMQQRCRGMQTMATYDTGCVPCSSWPAKVLYLSAGVSVPSMPGQATKGLPWPLMRRAPARAVLQPDLQHHLPGVPEGHQPAAAELHLARAVQRHHHGRAQHAVLLPGQRRQRRLHGPGLQLLERAGCAAFNISHTKPQVAISAAQEGCSACTRVATQAARRRLRLQIAVKRCTSCMSACAHRYNCTSACLLHNAHAHTSSGQPSSLTFE